MKNLYFSRLASHISLYSTPLSSTLGAADVYVDGAWSGKLELIPHNTPWSKNDLNANIVHTLAILPSSGSAQAFLNIDLFVLTLSVYLLLASSKQSSQMLFSSKIIKQTQIQSHNFLRFPPERRFRGRARAQPRIPERWFQRNNHIHRQSGSSHDGRLRLQCLLLFKSFTPSAWFSYAFCPCEYHLFR